MAPCVRQDLLNMAKIIHLIGPSGTGKSSVHRSLTPLLEQSGYAVVPLVEPGPLREQIQQYRKSPHCHPLTESLLYAADRSLLYAKEVLPCLHEPRVLFTFARGLPDSLVYQGIIGGVDPKEIMKLNKLIPPSDVYIALLVNGQVGHARVLERQRTTGEPVSPNEMPEAIDRLTRGYLQLRRDYLPDLNTVDTTHLSLDEVIQQCFALILRKIGSYHGSEIHEGC